MKPEHVPLIAIGIGGLLIILGYKKIEYASPLGVGLTLLILTI